MAILLCLSIVMKGKTMNVNSILNSLIKVLMITTLAIALCISTIFFIPPVYVHAVSGSQFYNFPFYSSQPSVDTILADGLVFENEHMHYFARSSSYPDTRCFYAVCHNSGSSSYDRYVLIAEHSVIVQFYNDASQSYGSVNVSQVSASQAGGSLSNVFYFGGIGTGSLTVLPDFIFDNSEQLFQAFDTFITEGFPEGAGFASFERTITIKPGYVAYVQTDGGTLDLVAQFHEYSRFSRPLWDNGVRISFNGGLVPTSGTTFGSSYGSAVDWLKVASAPSNLMGQTMVGGRFYDAGLPEAGSNSCVVIYNPAYNNANTLIGGGTIDIGPTITATFSNLVDVSQYALRADASVSYASGASITSGSDNSYNTPYVYVPSENDPSSVVSDSDYRLLDLSTNTSSPAITITAGGSNATADYGSTVAPEEAEKGLVGLLTRILQFLASPIEHVMNLFTAGGNFMAWLGQLWVWLPSDVGAILVDALIVLVVIGAIKFLWK